MFLNIDFQLESHNRWKPVQGVDYDPDITEVTNQQALS